MVLDKIVHHDRDLRHDSIFNAWVNDSDSQIMRTIDQVSEQRLLHKYKNIRFLDDVDNQTYMIIPENLDFKGKTRRNK